ncbi:MAG: beta-galactosidase [Salana multivorans]|uniref:glycoside hydrolase family 2 protein n=1 Tax=Salana multivorans TaxID=120377 RepID=UPI00096178A0|nr:sugar-binding domain-containing protein [Salana multivorans]MBN8883739.1 beta-galactosidase [Salana multivorans]OJX95395.1 MAG: beta-galactosidase [Micrococcales bacterium 73-15]
MTPTPDVPRPEHPRPQLVRPDWLTLNGTWQFEVDPGDSGLERGLRDRDLTGEILVPFAPESEASGIGTVDFLHAVWYRRTVRIPADWAGRTVLLHLGAVDHDATVWANGVEVARHRGGFTPFTANLDGVARPGEDVTIVVRARDTPREPQARGKQAIAYGNSACFYTRTTGIWQTVWLEAVPAAHIASINVVPQLADASLSVTAELSTHTRGLVLEAVLSDDAGEVSRSSIAADDLGPRLRLAIPADRVRTWSPDDPHLYDLVLRLVDGDGTVVDEVTSYAGLRSVAIDGHRILLNGEPVFQRLVLDQGYWPDTLMTAPSDADLRRDIELAMAAGFNGARLHQKVFEERYLYHADRLGFLVWGEFGDWGSGGGPQGDNQQPTASYVTQWVEAVRRDRSHPSIIGWCPLNETYQWLHDRITQLDDVTTGMYLATKAADPTRPVVDASGYSHRVRGADVYDSHSYEQDPAAFRREQAGLAQGRPFVNEHDGHPISVPYGRQPYFVSEYGGIWWNAELAGQPQRESSDDPERSESWGYGERVATLEEWHARFEGLTRVLLEDPLMFGYCYTQLTDTFQEENGLYDFHRRPKVDIELVRAVQRSRAAYEG